MRWNHQKYKEGDQRIRKKFLMFPKRLNNQTRWLETARIHQVYRQTRDSDGIPYLEWIDINWWQGGIS